MLLHACLSALNTAFLICLLGWVFFFLVLPTKISCCFLALTVNPQVLASNLYLLILSGFMKPLCFIHADLLNSTLPALTLALIYPQKVCLLPPLLESDCLAFLTALPGYLLSIMNMRYQRAGCAAAAG